MDGIVIIKYISLPEQEKQSTSLANVHVHYHFGVVRFLEST
jgi:hypothetical protein